ncbi:NUDIX hydrolase [Lyngbya confervoides]|uniref:NUDIX domain-containing protein n=1 Tax=Lyngbya confervoides BDU141951 TaxID=1574623 RepID=A0ABD4T634_9CYAN|nr:NUDIX domain-containing protein [Lyngbya confervoides]MCM1983940.1 NUDIX domain-containing protein [Lyngbya confervoides BDU141951]
MKRVAIAILYQRNPWRFLMQLRDPLPTIVYPGHWGLFGGHLEPGESPEQGLRRELWEEICYRPDQLIYLGNKGDRQVDRHVFSAELGVPIQSLILQEGWDMALLSRSQIELGACYSQKSGQIQPIGQPHLRALEAFLSKLQSGA